MFTWVPVRRDSPKYEPGEHADSRFMSLRAVAKVKDEVEFCQEGLRKIKSGP